MSDGMGWVEGFLRFQRWREAIASVSLSHPENCGCDVCAAAKGDEEAMARVIDQMAESEGA